METDPGNRVAARSIWRHRGRRFVTGLHVLAATALAVAAVVLVNWIAYRWYGRFDVSSRQYYTLSPKTQSLLAGLTADVRVVVFFQKNHEVYDDVRYLLREYEYAARPSRLLEGPSRLRVEFVDPDRDLGRTRELRGTYELVEPNVVVFGCGNRRKVVPADDIMVYRRSLDGDLLSGRAIVRRRAMAFRGEQAFSSAIQTVSQNVRPVVYFLTGHGEKDLTDFDVRAGYSTLARRIRGDNAEVKTLLLAEHKRVPEDCAALVVAGPRQSVTAAERGLIVRYLQRNGRLFLLLDAAATTGLESLAEDWGVKLGRDVVVDPTRTLTQREIFVTEYGDHPITRRILTSQVVLALPRSVEPADARDGPGPAEDRPRVTALMQTTKAGWAEMNAAQVPLRFDAGVDRAGPVGLAAAVEKGPVSGVEVEIRPTRMVVVGDSFFVGNEALKGMGSGNADFFMSALNWLLERESLMAMDARDPRVLVLGMDRNGIRMAGLVLVGLVPACVALLGVAVWMRRR